MKIITKSFQQMIRAGKLIGLYWFVYVMFSIPLFMAIDHTWRGNFASTGVAREWLTGFNAGYLLELLINQPSFLWMTSRGLIATLAVFAIVSVFMSAGTFGYLRTTLANSGDVPIADFFHAGSRYFGRFLRTGLWTAFLLVLAAIPMAVGSFGIVVTLPMAAVVLMTADLVRVRLVQHGEQTVTRLFFSTMALAIRRIAVVTLHYIPSVVLLLAGFLVYRMSDDSFIPTSIFLVGLMAVLQQCFVVFRSAIRVQMIGMATLLFVELSPPPQPTIIADTRPEPQIEQ